MNRRHFLGLGLAFGLTPAWARAEHPEIASPTVDQVFVPTAAGWRSVQPHRDDPVWERVAAAEAAMAHPDARWAVAPARVSWKRAYLDVDPTLGPAVLVRLDPWTVGTRHPAGPERLASILGSVVESLPG